MGLFAFWASSNLIISSQKWGRSCLYLYFSCSLFPSSSNSVFSSDQYMIYITFVSKIERRSQEVSSLITFHFSLFFTFMSHVQLLQRLQLLWIPWRLLPLRRLAGVSVTDILRVGEGKNALEEVAFLEEKNTRKLSLKCVFLEVLKYLKAFKKHPFVTSAVFSFCSFLLPAE